MGVPFLKHCSPFVFLFFLFFSTIDIDIDIFSLDHRIINRIVKFSLSHMLTHTTYVYVFQESCIRIMQRHLAKFEKLALTLYRIF
jgi:hypothetical protein